MNALVPGILWLLQAPDLSATPPTISKDKTAVWLEPARGYALAGMRVQGRWLAASAKTAYPSFKFVDGNRTAVSVACDAPGWDIQAGPRGTDQFVVSYTRSGTTVEVAYAVDSEAIRGEVSVMREGHLRVAEVGARAILGLPLGPEDYGIAPSGVLLRPPAEVSWPGGEGPVSNFVAARAGAGIVFYKPMTFAHKSTVSTVRGDKGDQVWLGGVLYFRPTDFENPKTKLCHSRLGWRVETAGDVNRDGTVDWVDAGLAYRNRYMNSNPKKPAYLKDSYLYYHSATPYSDLAALIDRIDFATGVWCVKGMMVTTQTVAGESHPYEVERERSLGDLAAVKGRILAQGSRVGPYYGHGYIDIDGGKEKWPLPFQKLDANGNPETSHRSNGRQLYSTDTPHSWATGLLQRRYEKLIQACRLEPDDFLQLDIFMGANRPGWHPEVPSTSQTDTEAKHELARWFKRNYKLCVTATGQTEGTQDVVDYGSCTLIDVGEDIGAAEKKKFWAADFPRKRVPLVAVIYQGMSYTGECWYGITSPKPNWATALAYGLHLWDWSMDYANLYEKTARYFFFQNIFWSRVADVKLADVDQKGSEYTLKFESGSVLWADLARNAFWLEEGGVRYDGFTPFNNRGVMAVLKQGDFDLTLPVKDMLEVLPSQPHRERLDVQISRTADGRVRVKGNFSKIPWKATCVQEGKDDTVALDVEPVLMLRRVR